MSTIAFDIDGDGIATLTIDVPGQSMNVIGPDFIADLDAAITRIASEDGIRGAVIASGKDSGFMAGMDLKYFGSMLASAEGERPSPADIFDKVFVLNQLFRRLETCGKPVACAIEGTCVGGGLELAMACHRRVVGDSPKTQLGLPEILIGLFPGGGGSQRMTRLMGVQAALMYMLQGKLFRPAEAAMLKVVDEVVPQGTALDTAKAWVKANPTASVQPWDVKGFKFPGGAGGFNPAFVQTMAAAVPMTVKQTQRNMNAPIALLSAVYEGAILPIDQAIRIESKYFARVAADPQASNMIRSLFVNKQAAERGARRPKDQPKAPTRKLAMLGAGMMGAGIATVAAQAGMEVMLFDRDQAYAEKGKAHVEEQLSKRLGKGMTPEKMAETLARVTPTTDYAALAGADFVIEAVFEDVAIKAEVTKKVEEVLGADTIFGSNTSTLPITKLAKAWSKPANFIGIHFFSPVEKMPLVEIILGRETGPAAIAKALDFVAQIKKTPIVVNDSRGFYTSRCFGTYVQEGVEMVAEGVNPALIENGGRQLGMPVGPLAVGDEVSIELGNKIVLAAKKELGDAYVPQRSDELMAQMVELGRLGRKSAKGWYDYPEGGKKHLWPGLADLFPLAADQPDVEAVKERLLYRQLIECARCFEEGVLETPEDGDIGAIFGWGFAPWTGGPFSHMDTVGIAHVVAVLDRLAAAHGERFAPTKQLREMAASGAAFYRPAPSRAAA
ncbi:3-hydroxyacyl-CoA dehydrogenase/enoyl-CoA hydratase/3-hydroxybutyryl-CoA epimerase [Sphingobium wenxiniae]|uniref:3-hydroxyacyl-CoA dehydrogenase/enoyl-CoA hydratase/3-hydroxybutyryl-CoA epimerase n=1 Tax=Sphingobium wenxiniae (strain DSM 21828 / CGMCC 1.7748 / JZ-1) TaxID=595605 RepID=A0A562KLH8_SPHWJ|nr:3-hydroxyacyl-CoA dehydrogenase NAD-binding domain-containing protein [Sphingobium wenxiniae]MBB6191117.1 3-hydroxyacyl-CoA dehydrogenase/enoyl-CoA hydratase/3-hydroxybutyryl-CoA epimerase [Sphingobium wenxiniae]TWH96083.1 3-hydroxyacyl-CoA dehydrogenase/enoyl-CoA hydratase/3-hydroxybutyryl-CoA epimerase [Sphingobium wenxiniae]